MCPSPPERIPKGEPQRHSPGDLQRVANVPADGDPDRRNPRGLDLPLNQRRRLVAELAAATDDSRVDLGGVQSRQDLTDRRVEEEFHLRTWPISE